MGFPGGMKKEGKQKSKKKPHPKKKEELGGLNNFIYYRKPKEYKKNPGRIFR